MSFYYGSKTIVILFKQKINIYGSHQYLVDTKYRLALYKCLHKGTV